MMKGSRRRCQADDPLVIILEQVSGLSREKGTGYNKMTFYNDLLTHARTSWQDYETRNVKEIWLFASANRRVDKIS